MAGPAISVSAGNFHVSIPIGTSFSERRGMYMVLPAPETIDELRCRLERVRNDIKEAYEKVSCLTTDDEFDARVSSALSESTKILEMFQNMPSDEQELARFRAVVVEAADTAVHVLFDLHKFYPRCFKRIW